MLYLQHIGSGETSEKFSLWSTNSFRRRAL